MMIVTDFIESLRELAKDAPNVLIVMPPNSVGLPVGDFIPESLLKYIADCLDHKVS